MSEETIKENQTNSQITTPTEKNPGRVAAGNKLLEFNRQNKAKKIVARKRPDYSQPRGLEISESQDKPIPITYIIGGVGIVVASLGLYIQYKQYQALKASQEREPEKVEFEKDQKGSASTYSTMD